MGDAALERQLGEAYYNLGRLAESRDCLQGQFERSEELAVELYASALERDHTQHKGWGLFGQGMSLLRLGKTDQDLHRLDQALPLSLAVSDNLTRMVKKLMRHLGNNISRGRRAVRESVYPLTIHRSDPRALETGLRCPCLGDFAPRGNDSRNFQGSGAEIFL